jgi:hypothetical protein
MIFFGLTCHSIDRLLGMIVDDVDEENATCCTPLVFVAFSSFLVAFWLAAAFGSM